MSIERHARLGALFQLAADLPPDERAKYLDAACGGDRALRGEVEELLARDAAPAVVDQPVVVLGHDDAGCAIPAFIGQYEILDVLGQGGMGVVYRARQNKPARVVALKVIHPALLTRDVLRRFEFETRVLAELRHPGVAQIHEAGTARDQGRAMPYFAMELVEGRPLTTFSDARRLSHQERLTLLLRVCAAVHHAHQKSVIHRDLKPANILVDDAGQPKILDFGVARTTGVGPTAATLYTQPGQIIGTLPYMSPEQIAGDPAAIDIRTDIYALGVIAYELLSGRLPHDLRQHSVADAARVIRDEEPTRLSVYDRSFRGDLETIIGKALHKDKEQRYASAAELAADTERYLRDEPILARPPSVRYQLAKFARRNRLLVSSAAAGLALLVCGIAGTTYGLVQARHERDAARLAQTRAERVQRVAEQESDKARAINQFLTRMLESASPLGEVQYGRHDLTVLEMLDRETQAIETAFTGQPALEAAVRITIGVVYRNLGRYELAEAQLRRALELARQTHGDPSSEVARGMRELASVLSARDRDEEAVGLLRDSLDMEERLGKAGSLEFALAAGRLGLSLTDRGELELGEQHIQRSLQILESLDGDYRADIATALNNLARLRRARGDDAQAEALYRRAHDEFVAIYGPQHSTVALTLNNLGRLMHKRGAYDEAEAAYRQAVDSLSGALGAGHPTVGDLIHNLGGLCLDRGNFAGAVQWFDQALRIYRASHGVEHSETMATLNSKAVALLKARRFAEGRVAFQTVAEFYRSHLGPEHWRVRLADLYGAECAAHVEGLATAEPELLRVFAAFANDGADNQDLARSAAKVLVRVYDEFGRSADADRFRPVADAASSEDAN